MIIMRTLWDSFTKVSARKKTHLNKIINYVSSQEPDYNLELKFWESQHLYDSMKIGRKEKIMMIASHVFRKRPSPKKSVENCWLKLWLAEESERDCYLSSLMIDALGWVQVHCWSLHHRQFFTMNRFVKRFSITFKRLTTAGQVYSCVAVVSCYWNQIQSIEITCCEFVLWTLTDVAAYLTK